MCQETRLIYMTKPNDCPSKSNDVPVVIDEAQASKLLEDLDLRADPVAGFATSPALGAVDAAQAKRRGKQAGLSNKQSAKDERLSYKLDKMHAGLGEPRPYLPSGIAPRRQREGDFETEVEFKRRYKREHARLKRGVTAEDIEANQTIRELTTPEEKKRKRADAEKERRANMTPEQKKAEAARKQRKRNEAKAEADAALAARRLF